MRESTTRSQQISGHWLLSSAACLCAGFLGSSLASLIIRTSSLCQHQLLAHRSPTHILDENHRLPVNQTATILTTVLTQTQKVTGQARLVETSKKLSRVRGDY